MIVRFGGQLLLSAFVTFACLVFGIGCAGVDGDVVIERVPGTEWASTESNSFTVSPDEDWLVFWEWMSDPAAVREHEIELPEEHWGWPYTLASINLRSLSRVRHSADNLATDGVLKRGFSTVWSMLGDGFAQDSWREDRCFIDAPRGSKDVVLDPANAELFAGTFPAATLACSDCAPHRAVLQRVERLSGVRNEIVARQYSVAWRNGRLSDNTYRVAEVSDGVAIEAVQLDGSARTVFHKKSKFKNLVITRLRISPSERYLAVVVGEKLKAPVPTPDHVESVYVVDFEAGGERRVVQHRFVGGLVWSSDDERLYFSGSGERATNPGIFVVEPSKLF